MSTMISAAVSAIAYMTPQPRRPEPVGLAETPAQREIRQAIDARLNVDYIEKARRSDGAADQRRGVGRLLDIKA